MSDDETLAAYATRVAEYEALVKPEPAASLVAFADALPEGGRVLDLGCGPGHAARYLAGRGFETHAWDACPEMVAAAEAPGVMTRVATFDALKEASGFDGVFASFSLLHAPRIDFAGHIAAIAAALTARGVLHLGMKLGTGEKRDGIGRFYSYFSREELLTALEDAGFEAVWEHEGEEAGLAGDVSPFILIRAVKGG
ncbi:MAG: methyltransferase domain-containing protein [Pseudomonadota bacterium]